VNHPSPLRGVSPQKGRKRRVFSLLNYGATIIEPGGLGQGRNHNSKTGKGACIPLPVPDGVNTFAAEFWSGRIVYSDPTFILLRWAGSRSWQ